jgi:uncharacterized protein (DUF2384 family)
VGGIRSSQTRLNLPTNSAEDPTKMRLRRIPAQSLEFLPRLICLAPGHSLIRLRGVPSGQHVRDSRDFHIPSHDNLRTQRAHRFSLQLAITDLDLAPGSSPHPERAPRRPKPTIR